MKLRSEDMEMAILRLLAGSGGQTTKDAVIRAGTVFQSWALADDPRVREVLDGTKWLAYQDGVLVTVEAT